MTERQSYRYIRKSLIRKQQKIKESKKPNPAKHSSIQEKIAAEKLLMKQKEAELEAARESFKDAQSMMESSQYKSSILYAQKPDECSEIDI